ncbi:hypothetical protein LUX12_10415 [Streptomyces somaliensis]|uniref:hypothetical protein n=1 Tax=Streptomyces somaliensis TaxID=78355 RepID=UPI0020CEF7B1|nr:hypothetical protein [Streptomyces somaliensis]MCP9945103.1 hypothetical protein [Streptomyces somaliensis]MCP9961683.1 hypothetical protein [Streptomyces somaliensis]
MSSYTLKVGETNVRARPLRDAQMVVTEHVTDLLARDPEVASQGALTADRAFSAGTVAHALGTRGSRQTAITVQGGQVEVSITRRRWWRWRNVSY